MYWKPYFELLSIDNNIIKHNIDTIITVLITTYIFEQ